MRKSLLCVCVQFEFGRHSLLLCSTNPSHRRTACLCNPPSSPLGAVQPLQGLTKILRALTFAGHLAHPHQSVEVALCSICDTWKHGSIGHQIKGAELKRPLLQLGNPPLKIPARPTVAKGGQRETKRYRRKWRPGKKKALWRPLQRTDEAKEDHLKQDAWKRKARRQNG